MKSSMSICSEDRRVTVTAPLTQQSRFREGSAMPAFGFQNSRASSSVPAPFPMSNELQVGQVLDDRFKILDVINRGGMAWIYEALDRQTGRPLVLKVPLMQFECDPGFFSRFQREENIGLTGAFLNQ
jgi:serine/threonine protein kinase